MMLEDFYLPVLIWLKSNPWLGLGITIMVFFTAQKIYQCSHNHPLIQAFLHPVLISIAVIILCLWFFNIDYASYFVGGQVLHFFLGPATVALAWPLYQNMHLLKKIWLPILISVVFGVLVGATSAIYLAQMLDANLLTQLSLASKSVTTPVAMAVVEVLGGIPELTAGLVIITGVIGAMFGALTFKLIGVDDPRVKGIAMGVSAHGVGTARALQINPIMGAFSGLAMALSALLIGFVLPVWLGWIGVL